LPAEAVYVAQLVLPGQFLATAVLPGQPTKTVNKQVCASNTPAPLQIPEDLLLARHVLVRKDGHVPSLAAAFDGPYLVLERSLRTFKLQIGNKQENVSTLRLKACFSPPDVQVAQPPKRGRPPKIATASSNNTSPSPPHTAAAASPAPPRLLQVSAHSSESVIVCTTPPTPFWPPCPLRRAAEAAPTQPRSPIKSLRHRGLGGSCSSTSRGSE
jgi:hypothetical protein